MAQSQMSEVSLLETQITWFINSCSAILSTTALCIRNDFCVIGNTPLKADIHPVLVKLVIIFACLLDPVDLLASY